MNAPAARDLRTRRADALAALTAPVADAWVATAGEAGPHLVPLTLVWFEEHVVLATDGSSPTARNLGRVGRARLGLGGTRDVVLIEATLARTVGVAEPAAAAVAEAYADRNDWDPRTAGAGYVFLWLRPVLVQAWREQNELAGRTLMRDGRWLVR